MSRETRQDLLRLFNVQPERVHVIHNGIDPSEYRPVEGLTPVRYGIDPGQPYLLFRQRITRQKGIMHLVNAIPAIDPNLQIVLCAGARIRRRLRGRWRTASPRAAAQRQKAVIWVREMVSRPDVIQLYSHAAVFCCPSIYEPFGIINLEAMACETAVVASAVGGIPGVILPDETGLLVDPHLQPGTFDPADPAAFSHELAQAINRLACGPTLRQQFGIQGASG